MVSRKKKDKQSWQGGGKSGIQRMVQNSERNRYTSNRQGKLRERRQTRVHPQSGNKKEGILDFIHTETPVSHKSGQGRQSKEEN